MVRQAQTATLGAVRATRARGEGRPDSEELVKGGRMTPDSVSCGRFSALCAVLTLSLLFPSLTSASDPVFGPVTCQRGAGAPTVFNYSFTAPEPSRGFVFKLQNGGLEDASYEQVSSSVITLNGVQILGPSNFSQEVSVLEVPIALQERNSLTVEVRGKPGGAISMKISPVVAITAPTPGEIVGARSVSVRGNLAVAAASVSVNGLPATIGAGTFSVAAVPLLPGSNKLTAIATGVGGVSGSDSIFVTSDTEPPSIGGLMPERGSSTGDGQTPISVGFGDGLSGIEVTSVRLKIDGSDVTAQLVISESGARYQPLSALSEGQHQVAVWVKDRAGNEATASWDFAVDVTPPTISIQFPVDGSTVGSSTVNLVGSVDDVAAAVTVNGTSVELTGGNLSVPDLALAIGVNEFQVEASDALGNTSAVVLHVTYLPPPPLTSNVSLSASSSTIHLGESTTLSWTTTDTTGVLINQGIGRVQPSGAMVVQPTSTTEYVLTASGPEGVSRASVLVTVLGSAEPQPAGSYGAKYQDLIPRDATVIGYDPKRFSLVTGKVRDRDNVPIAGVRITIPARADYGTATTNDVGEFAIPVEGGGILGVSYQKSGLIRSHRQVDVPWNDIAIADTVTMLPEDMAATKVVFNGDAGTVIVHRGSVVADVFGSRSATIVFAGDNRAYATVEDAEIELDSLTVRSTEFDTPAAMPAKLPSSSAYTYCADLSVDGASDVRFERAVTVYVDNFLGFDVGQIVPVGYYDRKRGVWMPSGNGVVVRLLDTNGDGSVDALDTVGDGQSHTTEVAGLTDPERFRPNSTYWRVSVSHFTPWDFNWPYGPPLDAIQPNPEGIPVADQWQSCDAKDYSGSYCERKSRILHEDIPIAGTSMALHYASNRVPGYKARVSVPASGNTVPASLTKIVVKMEVAGRVLEASLPALPGQKAEFVWDGLDPLGNQVIGTTTARIGVGFVYKSTYYSSTGKLAQAWATVGETSTGVRGREDITVWKYNTLRLQHAGSTQFAEGWTLPIHHLWVPSTPSQLYKGDGSVLERTGDIMFTVAGSGKLGFAGDGGPANQADLASAEGVARDGAGNLFIADSGNNRIRKVDNSGVITTVAGTGEAGYSGEGMPGLQARLRWPSGLAMDNAGNLYIADSGNNRVRKLDPSGIITTVAGTGVYGFGGDGGPAVQARLSSPTGVAVDGEGNVFIADKYNCAIRKVTADGMIATVAGAGCYGRLYGDGGLATRAWLSWPSGVSVDHSGNLYIADTENDRIRKVDTKGIITSIAGSKLIYATYDSGFPATQTILNKPAGLYVDSVGNLFFSDSNGHRIRKVDTSGMCTIVAGAGYGYGGDRGPATHALLCNPVGISVDDRGRIYIADAHNSRIRMVSDPLDGLLGEAGAVTHFVDDNGLGYAMSGNGLHKSTFDLATRETLLTFGYSPADQLMSVTDRFGNQTTIQRDSAGKAISITSPDGVVTDLATDGENHLTQVSYPDGTHFNFEYTQEGLMTNEFDRSGSLYSHRYDADGRVASVSDPEGGVWDYSRATDAAGNVFSAMLTAENNLVSYQSKSESTGAFTSVSKEPNGEVTTFNRTADGQSETSSSSCGMKESRQFGLDPEYLFRTATSAITTTPSGLKHTESISRSYQDANGDSIPDLITYLVSKDNRSWEATENTLAGVTTTTSPCGRVMTTNYDPVTLLTRQISVPGTLPTTFEYDARGRMTRSTRGNRTTTIAYDANGSVDYVVTPDNQKLDYSFDAMGNLRSLERPDGSVVQYDYDQNGSMTVLTGPSSVADTFGYTANKQRSTWTTPLSGSYRYTYDKEKKLKAVAYPSGKVVYISHVNGQVASVSSPESTTHFVYGCGSNLGSLTSGEEKVSFTYDGSQVTSDTRSGTLDETIRYTYNSDFALSALTYSGANLALGYDDDGLLTTSGNFAISRNVQNGLPEGVNGLGLAQARAFSGNGELDGATTSISGVQTYAWSVPARDNAGRILRRLETIDGSTIAWEYTYNTVGRLVEVLKDGLPVERYAYDLNGNRLSETNTLRGIAGKSYGYSLEDHVLSAGADSYQFDVDGFLQIKTGGGGTTRYSYTTRGELATVWLASGDTLTYVNDPAGRRIAKKVNGAITEKYLWKDQTTLLALYDGNDNLLQRYTYADARVPISMTTSGATYYLLTDQVGSLRAVADTSGVIVKRIDYDSFGNIIADSNPGFEVPFGFAGGLHDRDTGLVRFGFRDYSPELGRFTAKDPIDFAGGDTNLYAYTMNDPVNLVDPSGLLVFPWHFGLTFAVAFSSGRGFVESTRLGWQTVAADIGTQGTAPQQTNLHAMAGRGQSPGEAIEATIWQVGGSCSQDSLATRIHAAQDLATPEHAGKPWGGFHFDWATAKHFWGDIFPSITTIFRADDNTRHVLEGIGAISVP
jgi:RHS repeat-associated protein